MKRREFIRNLSVTSIAVSVGTLNGFAVNRLLDTPFSLLDTFSLNGFDDETEEYPQLVTNGEGENWMFSLRRLPYPTNQEDIACYKYVDRKWQDNGTVTWIAGQYENPTAICLQGEEPWVAWNTIVNGKWEVQVSKYNNGNPSKPISFKAPEGKAVNPKLVAGENGTVWLTWENYFERNFSIYVCKYQSGNWSGPVKLTADHRVCFDPAIAEGNDGKLYLAYGTTDGFHQNIEMKIFDASSLSLIKQVPIAIGGGLKNRVNLNTKPALAFDKNNRLWISWENNRNTHRLDDGDNYSGDRCCSMVAYINGKVMEPESTGRWLFNGKNDHLPTFVKDLKGNLYAFTRCGGDFNENYNWKFRVSVIGPEGWSKPETILPLDQKWQTSIPAVIFNNDNQFWLAWRLEKNTQREHCNIKETKINLSKFSYPSVKSGQNRISFVPAVVEEHHPKNIVTNCGGRHRIDRQKMVYNGEEYTLILGDLHEHSEGSPCWPAGTDGTLHDDYRYGLYSEGYDFVGITDHAESMDETYWRKNLRVADFYNEDGLYVAIPSIEWTCLTPKGYNKIPKGVGHRNIIFASTGEAEKFVRNGKEMYSSNSPECDFAPKLWELIHEKSIDCVAIPHHVTDEMHPCDWSVRDEEIEPIVELFQCRGNAEYRGCPRENNLDRHHTTHCDEAFMDYALREKGYKIGFIGSGEHNNMGIGLAALWVKEVSRKGIIEALRARRCFGTTGDKIFMDVKVDNAFMGEIAKLNGVPEIQIKTQGQKEIERVELLRNSRVIKSWKPENADETFMVKYIDEHYQKENDVLYYYVRVRQNDEHLAWSSPVFFEKG
ncbi:MAG: DUF3604 domain-containing protein [Prolixibacteraceae bacterium]|nr:DUF3604 domain-containing protein [Prolixibacteraceae bacterium]